MYLLEETQQRRKKIKLVWKKVTLLDTVKNCWVPIMVLAGSIEIYTADPCIIV